MAYNIPETDLAKAFLAASHCCYWLSKCDGFYTIEDCEQYDIILTNQIDIKVVSGDGKWVAEEVLGLQLRRKPFKPNCKGLAWKMLNESQKEAVSKSDGTAKIHVLSTAVIYGRDSVILYCNNKKILHEVTNSAAFAFAEDLGLEIKK